MNLSIAAKLGVIAFASIVGLAACTDPVVPPAKTTFTVSPAQQHTDDQVAEHHVEEQLLVGPSRAGAAPAQVRGVGATCCRSPGPTATRCSCP